MGLPVVIASLLSIGLHLGFLFFARAPAWEPVEVEPLARDVELVQVFVPGPLALSEAPPESSPTPQQAPPSSPCANVCIKPYCTLGSAANRS